MKRGFSGELKCESAELKRFSIPRKPNNHEYGNLVQVEHGSMEERDILSDVQKTAINCTYDKLWKVRFVKLIHNPSLENNFCDKRRELKQQGSRSAMEELAFSVETVYGFEQLLQEGQWAKPCRHSLGNPQMGISLFRHVDVALRFAEHMGCGSPVEVVVHKVVLGRPKMIRPRKSASDGFLEPTPNYDSHVSSIKPTNTDMIFDLLERSTVYLYEYDDQATPVSHPRHCVPIAVVSFNNFTMPYLGLTPKFLLGSDISSRWTVMKNQQQNPYQPEIKEKEKEIDVKKEIKRAMKKETKCAMKEYTKSAMKKETKCTMNKGNKIEVKKKAKIEVKKETQSEVNKEPNCFKKESLEFSKKKNSSVEIGSPSKSSKKSSSNKKGIKSNNIGKICHLDSKHLQQCDKISDEESTLTVPSQVDTTKVKTDFKLPSSGKSKNTSCGFLKRLLQTEFLRRKAELQRRLLHSEAELDEGDRLVLEMSVHFIQNEHSDVSTDNEGEMIVTQDSASVSDFVKKEKLRQTQLEHEAISISEEASMSVKNESFKSIDGAQYESNVEAKQTDLVTEDVPGIKNRDISSVSNEHRLISTKEQCDVGQCDVGEDTLNKGNKDKFSLETKNNEVLSQDSTHDTSDVAYPEQIKKVIDVQNTSHRKSEISEEKLKNISTSPEKKSKYRSPRKEIPTFSSRTCIFPRKHKLERKNTHLNKSSKDCQILDKYQHRSDQDLHEKKVIDVQPTRHRKSEISEKKLKNISTSPGKKSRKSKYRSPRKEIPTFSSRTCLFSRKHKLERKNTHLKKSSKDCQILDKYQHRSDKDLLEKKHTRSKEVDACLPIITKNESEQFVKNQDDTDKLKTETLPATGKSSKLSTEEALNKLHNLLQQTGQCSIDFSTITDILTGKILAKVAGNTAPEATTTITKGMHVIQNMQVRDEHSKLPSATCVQTETETAESHSNNADQIRIANEFVVDSPTNRVIQTDSSNENSKTELHVYKSQFADPRLESARQQNSQVKDLPLYPSTIDVTEPPTALSSSPSTLDTTVPSTVPSSQEVHSKKTDMRNHIRTLKSGRPSIQKQKQKKKSDPRLKQSDSKSGLSGLVGTAPRANCKRPLTCPFYSVVSSTFVWKAEKIDLFEKSTTTETDVTAKNDGKPKFNGRTLLKGGVDPRNIPLQKIDSVLLDPRKKKSAKQTEKVELKCQTSITSESGSCFSITSPDSGLADMDICETTNCCNDLMSMVGKQQIATDDLDTERIADLLNDPKQQKAKPPEQDPAIGGALVISPNAERGTYVTALQVKFETPFLQENVGENMCDNMENKEQQPYYDIPLRAAPPSTGCLSMSGTPTQSVKCQMSTFRTCNEDFPDSRSESAFQGSPGDVHVKTEWLRTDAPVMYRTASESVPLSNSIYPANDGSLQARNVGISQKGISVTSVKTEGLPADQANQSPNHNQPVEYSKNVFPEARSAKTDASQIGIQYFDQGPQNPFVVGTGNSNMVWNSQNFLGNRQNVNCSNPNPCFSTQPFFSGLSTVFQPMAGECRTENYLAHSPFAFSNNLPMPPANITPLGQECFDARQRINQIRCAKLISDELIPGHNYMLPLSQNCFNGTAGLKRPLSGAFDESSGKRFRSNLHNIDFDDVLKRIKAAAKVVTACTRLPPVMPRYTR